MADTRRKGTLVVLVGLMALGCGACRSREGPRSAAGGVYRFGPAPPPVPRKIVSMAPNMTEALFAIGAGRQVVAVTRFCNYPPEARRLPKIGGFLDPSLEAIVALRPDLVVGVPNSNNRRTVEALGERRIPVLLVESHRLEEVYRLIDVVGRAVGRAKAAETLVGKMRARVARVRERTRNVPRTRVLLAYGRQPLIVAGPGSFGDELLRLAGATNIVDRGTRYPTYSIERVIRLAPDAIVESAGRDRPGVLTAIRKRWSRYRSLPAVRSGRIHWLDPQLIARPGPRLVDALERLAAAIHPARFNSR